MELVETNSNGGLTASQNVNVAQATASGTGSSKRELEELWSGDIQFFNSKGTCLATGLSNVPSAAVLVIQLVGYALLFAFPVPYLTTKENQPAYAIFAAILALLTLTNFALTATLDPGLLPRCPKSTVTEPGSQLGAFSSARPPVKQNIISHGQVVIRRYCDTCNIFQPPRTVHCPICKTCVQKYDHHCPWVGTCIGARNYRFFFFFNLSATVILVYSIALGVLHLTDLAATVSARDVLLEGAGSLALIILCCLTLLFVLALVGFHIQLLCTNRTTYEQINRTRNLLRPIGRGYRAIYSSLFGPVAQSYVKRWVALNQAEETPQEYFPSSLVYGLGNEPIAKQVSLAEFNAADVFGSMPLVSSSEDSPRSGQMFQSVSNQTPSPIGMVGVEEGESVYETAPTTRSVLHHGSTPTTSVLLEE